MDSVLMLERQKEREGSWAARGAASFLKRLEDGDPILSPTGKAILKRTSDRFVARLRDYLPQKGQEARPANSPLIAVVAVLGARSCW
jgi:hypothetical protein